MAVGMATPALVGSILFFSLVLIFLAGGAWFFFYGALGKRLKERGIEPKPNYHGRVNAMDAFFAKLKFVAASEDRALSDPAITRLCLACKFSVALMALGFLVMVFGPFFLSDH